VISAKCECPECNNTLEAPDFARATSADCPCGWHSSISPEAIAEGKLIRCPICGTEEMYVQKDFPERVGVLVVVAAVVLATIAWAYYSPLWTFGILFLFGVADWIFFRTRPEVTICYRCLSQFRGVRENEAHRAFDLGVNERFRQERMRKKELRQTQPAPNIAK
jgi:hypothetical protein